MDTPWIHEMPHAERIHNPQITISIPREMAAFVRGTVQDGNYSSVSEVVREALRDWRMKAGERGLISKAKV
jgi:Arc/MetJ-type ribon-helix-helix transcriptional regulator